MILFYHSSRMKASAILFDFKGRVWDVFNMIRRVVGLILIIIGVLSICFGGYALVLNVIGGGIYFICAGIALIGAGVACRAGDKIQEIINDFFMFSS